MTGQAPAQVPRPARRTGRRWLVVVFVMVITAVAFIDRVNLSIAAPALTAEFGVNPAVMGLLLSSFTWSYTLLNVPAGMLVDRVRTRVVYAVALLVWALASFLAAVVNSIGALFGPRLLLGVGEAPFIPAAVRTLSDWLPRAERGTGASVLIAGIALGSAAGPPVLGWVVSAYGWRACFVATGVLTVLVAVAWYAWYRHPDEDRRLSGPERALIRAGQDDTRPAGHAPWRALVRHREIWALSIGYFCLLYILYTFVSWVPSYLVADRQMTILRSGFATAVPWVCAFVVAVLAGRVSDVAIRRGMPVLAARKIVLVGGMLAALAVLGTAFSASATVAIVCLSVSTSGIIFADGAVLAAIADVARRLNLAGSAAGFVNTVGNAGGILGPIVTGWLVYLTHSFVAPLVAAAGLALLGALVWLIGIRSNPPGQG